VDGLDLHRERAAKLEDAVNQPVWEFVVFRNPDEPGEPECFLINLPWLGGSLKPMADLRQGSGLTLERLRILKEREGKQNPDIRVRITPMLWEYLRDWYLLRGGDWRAMKGVWLAYSGWQLEPPSPPPSNPPAYGPTDYGAGGSDFGGFGY
jgi:hypothetical protein